MLFGVEIFPPSTKLWWIVVCGLIFVVEKNTDTNSACLTSHLKFTFIIYWIRLVEGLNLKWGNRSRFTPGRCGDGDMRWCWAILDPDHEREVFNITPKFDESMDYVFFSECKICKEIVVSFWQRNFLKGSYYRVLQRKWIDHSQNHHNLSWLMHLVFSGSIFCHSHSWCYL